MATQRTKAAKAGISRTKAAPRAPKTQPPAASAPLDITTRDLEGRTPLHLAAFYGYASLVRKMLQQLADVNARDNSQRTPGHWSAYKGHLEVIKLLVEFGADINARDAEGRTLLRMALIGRHHDMEVLLRVHGAVL